MHSVQQEDVLFRPTLFEAIRSCISPMCLLPLFLFACQQTDFPIDMQYADVKSGRELPYATVQRFDLTPVDSVALQLDIPENVRQSALLTSLTMGNSGQSLLLLLAKTDPQSHYYDQLFVDRNKDGDFSNDGPPNSGQGQFVSRRNQHYSEFDRVALPYDWLHAKTQTEEPFLCKIYFWYPVDGGTPKTCSLMRLCWREGRFRYGDQQAVVVMVDDDGNGIYDSNDRWALFPQDSLGEKPMIGVHFFRDATQLGWLDETAFELHIISPKGDRIHLRRKEIAVSKKEDLSADAPYQQEVRRPRAASDIEWMTSYRSALRRARSAKQNLFVNFCTSWSGPCVVLEERTFRDAEVVSLSKGFVCLELDGDLERTLAQQFNVQNYPTLLILDANGQELARVAGYQPAAELSGFLKQYRK